MAGFIDHSAEAKEAMREAILAALEAMGNQCVNHTKSNITAAGRVDTGALRWNILYRGPGELKANFIYPKSKEAKKVKTKHGFRCFGFFAGLPYGDCDERIDDYRKMQNSVKKADVLKRFDSISPARTSAPTHDIFTGEAFGAGLYQDGDFLFTTDFVRYYRKLDIGIPPEYEKYLLSNNFI